MLPLPTLHTLTRLDRFRLLQGLRVCFNPIRLQLVNFCLDLFHHLLLLLTRPTPLAVFWTWCLVYLMLLVLVIGVFCKNKFRVFS